MINTLEINSRPVLASVKTHVEPIQSTAKRVLQPSFNDVRSELKNRPLSVVSPFSHTSHLVGMRQASNLTKLGGDNSDLARVEGSRSQAESVVLARAVLDEQSVLPETDSREASRNHVMQRFLEEATFTVPHDAWKVIPTADFVGSPVMASLEKMI